MEPLADLILKIANLFGFAPSSDSKNRESYLFPLPREPLILLVIFLVLGSIATLLYFVFNIDIKTYAIISSFIVVFLTLIILTIIKKIYTSIEISKIKKQNN